MMKGRRVGGKKKRERERERKRGRRERGNIKKEKETLWAGRKTGLSLMRVTFSNLISQP